MNFCTVIVLSAASFLTLLVLSRLMGHRQISQMSMFDYVSSISIGSIAAELATKLDGQWWPPLLAMCVFALLTVLLALGCRKSTGFRQLVNGTPKLLYQDGKLYRDALRRAQLDVSDLLSQMRGQGYFDLAGLQAVVQEPSGQLSFLPVTEKRPVQVQDLDLHPAQDGLVVNLVLDGKVLAQNLQCIHRDGAWLKKELAAQGCAGPADVLLATWDTAGTLTVYPANQHDPEPEKTI